MTALDQAFIRAYAQQHAAPAPAAPAASGASADAAPPSEPDMPATLPLSTVLAALDSRPAEHDADLDTPAFVEPEPEPDASIYRLDAAVQTAVSPGVAANAVPPPHTQPLGQPKSFTWPAVCNRLISAAAGQFDRLCDALMAGKDQGRKVLALCGCRRGDGATTLLLCAARRLAERGLRIALVDADWADPQLARRLGLYAQAGWDAVLAGEALLADVVIESAQHAVGLLPWRQPLVFSSDATADASRLRQSLDTLSAAYDLVLVDLGPAEESLPRGEALRQAVLQRLDGVLLIHNVRLTTAERLAAAQERLAAEGAAQAGIIENLV